MRGDDRRRRAQQRREDVGGIEASLIRGAQETRQDLLRVGASARSIAAAADFAGDDRRTQRLLGPPVKCRAYCYAESRLSGLR